MTNIRTTRKERLYLLLMMPVILPMAILITLYMVTHWAETRWRSKRGVRG